MEAPLDTRDTHVTRGQQACRFGGVIQHRARGTRIAYDVYADTLDDLRSFHRVDLDLIETVERAAFSTGGFEAEALSYALCDYLAGAPHALPRNEPANGLTTRLVVV